MDKTSYAFGIEMGRQLQELCGEAIDIDDFARAVRDIFTGSEPVIDEAESERLVYDFVHRRNAAKKAEQAKIGEANKVAGEKFLAENAKRTGVVVLADGLQYEVVRQGTGRKPTAADSVKCHYEGKLIDGTMFDSSRRRGEPATFPLNGVISGWTEGLQLMQEGAIFRFFIPYNLAYGANGTGADGVIPPYAALVFEVELIKVL